MRLPCLFPCFRLDASNPFSYNSNGEIAVSVPMLGRCNASNIPAAVAVLHRMGFPLPAVRSAIEAFEGGIPGRMHILMTDPIRAVIDFAHTPESLQAVLVALRPTTIGRLIVVIGSAGGNRDPGKRAPLGRTAVRYADIALFTGEDCRTTPVEEILDSMEAGARSIGAYPLEEEKSISAQAADRPSASHAGDASADTGAFLRIADRKSAIWKAIDLAQTGDMLLFAGKGTEPTLERKDQVLPWDEATVVRDLLRLAGLIR